jgi:hypothetical protein
MGNLDAWGGAVFLEETDDSCKRLDMFVLPDTKISVRNPAASFDGSGFYQDGSGPSNGAASKVNHMPIVYKTAF